MNLLQKLLSKKGQVEYFLILIIRQETIHAKIIQIKQDRVATIGSGQSKFIEGKNEAEAIDIAISSAEGGLAEDIFIENVIFALPQTYIDPESEDIKPDYKTRLKKISQDLGLVTHGFVEYPQTLVSYFQQKDEAPISAILIGVYKSQLAISLVRVGKIKQNILQPRTSDLTLDIGKAFAQFSVEILPSRIIFYDGDETTEELKEQFLKYPWHKHRSFLHTPKIETIAAEKVNEAVVSTVGSSFFDKLSMRKALGKLEPKAPDEEVKREERKKKSDFGFVKEKDVADYDEQIEVVSPDIHPKEKEIEKRPWLTAKISTLVKSQKFKLPKMSVFSGFSVSWIGLAVALAAFLALTYWFYPKATIFLIVYPQTSTKKIGVIFTTSLDARVDENTIKAQSIKVEVEGEKTTSTTGTTKVGKPASGKVVIYNKTTTSKTFPEGTILQGGQLSFTLDDQVTIASASDTGESLDFGKTEVNVTASTIGPEGNLEAGTNFVVKDFSQSQYSGKNTDKFSGGSSREISTVSNQDQENLLTQLTDELKTSGKQKLNGVLSQGQTLIEPSIVTFEIKKEFSHQPGDETREVTLNLTLSVGALSFKTDDLDKIAEEVTLDIPEGFIIESKRTNIEDFKIEENQDKVKATVNVTFLLRPEVDLVSIKSKLVGKSYLDVSSLLSQVDHIGGVEIILQQSLPLFNNRLPWNGNNIELQLKSKN